MLVPCPGCGKRVSPRAPVCPFCRARLNEPSARPPSELGTPFRPGERVEGLRILKLLGEGGFGQVFLAESSSHGIVAVKTLRDELLHDDRVVELFRKEALIWIDLGRHPHIVQAKLVDEANGRLFIAMEFVPPNDMGLNDLGGYLERRPPDLGRALWWAVEFCDGMEYAYSRGIRCHRDIKPPNILIASDGRVRITDFGIAGVILARSSPAPMSALAAAGAGATMAGISVGTPTHMPPEQFVDAASCDARSDVYSFGIVLFQMAARRLPFDPPRVPPGPDAMPRLWAAFHESHLEAEVPRIDSPLQPIIDRCLEKDPALRYPAFGELRSALEALLEERTGERVSVAAPGRPEVLDWVNKGLSLASLGELEQALRCYDQALALDPDVKEALNNKGNSLGKLGRLDEALRCLDRALAIDPNYRDALLNKAITLARMRETGNALACLDRVLEMDPRIVDAWVTKGVVHGNLGQDELAFECYERALQIDPRHPVAWCNKGAKLHAAGRLGEALECIESSLRNDPRYVIAWNSKGVLLGDMGRYPEALEALERATALAPGDGMGWYNKGNSLARLERMEEAHACFVRSTELQPRFPAGWNNRGLAECHLERYTEAQRTFEKYLEMAPPNDPFRRSVESLLARLRAGERVSVGRISPGATTFSSLGARAPDDEAELDRLGAKFLSGEKLTDEEYARLDELLAPTNALIEEALGITSPAAAGDARDLQSLVSRGAALLREKQLGPALRSFDGALAIDRSCAEAWSGRGECLFGAERYADALASFDRGLALHPGNDRSLHVRGRCLERLGRREEALESFDRAIAIDPGHFEAYHDKSATFFHLRRFPEALEASRKATTLRESFHPAWQLQGRCLHALERYDEALRAFDRALALGPGDPHLDLARAETLDAMGRREEAIEAYRRFVAKATARDAASSQRARDRIAALTRPAERSAVPLDECLKRAAINRNQKNYAQAAHWFEQAVRVDSGNAAVHLALAECLSAMGRNEEAGAALDRAVALAPRNAEAWYRRGVALQAKERLEEALLSFEKATTLDAGYLVAWASRGEALLALGRMEEALACFDSALARDSRFAMARFHKAGAEDKLGRRADAARSFQQFLSTAPPSLTAQIQHARARLTELRKP